MSFISISNIRCMSIFKLSMKCKLFIYFLKRELLMFKIIPRPNVVVKLTSNKTDFKAIGCRSRSNYMVRRQITAKGCFFALFRSDFTWLCYCQHSVPATCHLNKQILLILPNQLYMFQSKSLKKGNKSTIVDSTSTFNPVFITVI